MAEPYADAPSPRFDISSQGGNVARATDISLAMDSLRVAVDRARNMVARAEDRLHLVLCNDTMPDQNKAERAHSSVPLAEGILELADQLNDSINYFERTIERVEL